MPAAPPPVIRATNLRKHYGAHAVVMDVSFELAAGETLVLLGPSGCGKTTLLKLLNRLIEPDGGTVEINGHDVQAQRPEVLRRGMGYVIQQVGLLPHYTVAENIAVVPRLLGHAPATIAARTEALLTRLHLPPGRYAGQLPQQLSGGQQQRVGLARALAADPPIVLLDEPFGALDPITRASIRREFRELEELRSKTVVLVTHDVTEAFELADRILLLDAGRVQQLGTPRELLFRPANDFVRRFFAAERLALQLRTLTLGDLWPSDETNRAGVYVSSPAILKESSTVEVSSTAVGKVQPLVEKPRPLVGKIQPPVEKVQPSVEPSQAVDEENQSAVEASSTFVPLKQPSIDINRINAAVSQSEEGFNRSVEASGKAPVRPFARETTVHEALEQLTGIAAAEAPFTMAQLMAAFGAALQREEDAWKR